MPAPPPESLPAIEYTMGRRFTLISFHLASVLVAVLVAVTVKDERHHEKGTAPINSKQQSHITRERHHDRNIILVTTDTGNEPAKDVVLFGAIAATPLPLLGTAG
jgi:hypothetical protein